MPASVRWRTIIGTPCNRPKPLVAWVSRLVLRCLAAHRHRHGSGRNIGVHPCGRCAVPKLDSSLAIGRATYERWLGTEPEEIAAAAETLRRFEPEHPSLVHLEVRFRRALQMKAMLAEILHESWRRTTTRTGGGYSRASPPQPAPPVRGA